MASPLEPVPFVPGICIPGGSSGSEFDTQAILLCDILDDVVVGSALAVYVYDETTGAPVGPPTFVDPGTGAPYVVQGTLQPCPSAGGDCCPVVIGSGCATGGRRWSAILDSLGAVTLVNQEDGTDVLPGDIVTCPPTVLGEVEVTNDVGNPIPVVGIVALEPATLAALESITATISGDVDLSAATLAALETINAIITGTVALDAPTLAALENITATIAGDVDLSAATLAALENITAIVSGAVGLDALTLWNTGTTSVASTITPVDVIPTPTAGRKTFAVKAVSTNTQPVRVGSSSADVLAGGWELAAGESVVIEVDTTTGCWVLGTTATPQDICFIEIV